MCEHSNVSLDVSEIIQYDISSFRINCYLQNYGKVSDETSKTLSLVTD